MNDYGRRQRESLKRAYVAVMLWFVGRALQAAARAGAAGSDGGFEALPEGSPSPWGLPAGPG